MLSNRLAQRAGSAVTVGVAAYILSLPDVAQWLDHGVGPHEIAETLTAGLPARITRRPARPLPGLPDVGGGLRATRRLTFA
ncbi:MAG: hypothetical protein HOY75_26770 [Streptomyces sp.]|nr:hypothetical protein [Streptomyces sp.]